MIVAIDGPAGAGKSTVAKKVAKELSFLYIDTGALYRALTLKILENGVDIKDTAEVIDIASRTGINLVSDCNGVLKVILDGQDVTSKIREPRITKFVSEIAKIKDVRSVMLELQRRFGKCGNCILDGRDIGTVVFPKAEKKFYLDAIFGERVRRRYEELKDLDQTVTLGEVASDLSTRDIIDSTREVAPLKKADDAIYIDTTRMSIDEVVNKILSYIH